jgi:hypothetical protein
MRTASLVLAAAALAALAFALPTVSASTTCTPSSVPVIGCALTGPAPGQACAFAGMSPQFGYGGTLVCADVLLPPGPTDLAPSHVCASAAISPAGPVAYCPVTIFHYGLTCVATNLLVYSNTLCLPL